MKNSLDDEELTKLAVESLLKDAKNFTMKREREFLATQQRQSHNLNKSFLKNLIANNHSHNARVDNNLPSKNYVKFQRMKGEVAKVHYKLGESINTDKPDKSITDYFHNSFKSTEELYKSSKCTLGHYNETKNNYDATSQCSNNDLKISPELLKKYSEPPVEHLKHKKHDSKKSKRHSNSKKHKKHSKSKRENSKLKSSSASSEVEKAEKRKHKKSRHT